MSNKIKDNNADIEYDIDSLKERKKELECIYKVEEVLKDYQSSILTILNQLVEIIPKGWQYDDICRVKISIGKMSAETKGFKETKYRIDSNLLSETRIVGEICLCYIKPVKNKNGVFLDEEFKLFSAIVDKLNQYILFRSLKDSQSKDFSPKLKSDDENERFNKWLTSLHLSPTEISILTKVPIEFKKSENIIKQGTFASYVMILKTGLVKISIENLNYRNHVFRISKPYSIMGLSNLYGDNYYHFSVKALVNSKVYLVERDVFDSIIKNNQKFAVEVMKMYCDSLQNLCDKFGSIVNKQALGRVCDVLIYLSQKIFESNNIQTSVSRKDMSEFAGLSTENFVRILSELKKDNIITIHSKSIEINDFERLKKLSQHG